MFEEHERHIFTPQTTNFDSHYPDVSTIVADGLAIQGSRALAAMGLT